MENDLLRSRTVWQRDHGWHLCAFAPSPVDVFRLRRAWCARDLQPGTRDLCWRWSFSALVVRRRPLSSHVCFTDTQIAVLPSLVAGWKRWHASLSEPATVCGAQLRWSRGAGGSSTLWRLGTLCESGAVVRVCGHLMRTLGGGLALDVEEAQILRCAPTPQCIERLCACTKRQPGEGAPLLSHEDAMLALHCPREDVFARLLQRITVEDCDDAEGPARPSRRQRRKQRQQQQQQQQRETPTTEAAPAAAATPKRQQNKSAAARAQTARRKTLAAWARYLRGAEARRARRRAARVSNQEHGALARAEAMPCSTAFAPRDFPYPLLPAEQTEALQQQIASGTLDPHRNVPVAAGWRRLRYIEQKKQPQVQWMCARVCALLAEMRRRTPAGCCTRHIVDVGGGRGDLALAVAAAAPDCEVCVVDTNAESLEAGRARAEQEHLAHRMRFVCARIEDVARDLHCDLVIGLHACGGLGEFALRLAVEQQASFLVCTCCFNSNPGLAVLTRPAHGADGSEGEAVAALRPPPELVGGLLPRPEDVCMLCEVAERKATQSADTYHRAMHAVNAVRLSVVDALFRHTHANAATLEACQTQFDARWSGANCVLVGLIVRPAATPTPIHHDESPALMNRTDVVAC